MIWWPNLYAEVLERPYRNGFRNLKVLTAYASSAFVHHILQEFDALRLELVLGMARREPIPVWDHNEYLRLVRETGRATVWYFIGDPPIHAKAVLWSNSAGRATAFIGSANFSWSGFRDYQEAMIPANPQDVEKAFPHLSSLINCTDQRVFERIRMSYQRKPDAAEIDTSAVGSAVVARGCPRVRLPLTQARSGRIHNRSGLNWGQRPGREPNQAYIPIPRRVHAENPDFFPKARREFTIITDDGESFVCVIAQDNNKAIETSRDNSILGKYFRRRLGVPLGARVTDNDLQRYGRDYVTIYKIDDSTYFLDFSTRR